MRSAIQRSLSIRIPLAAVLLTLFASSVFSQQEPRTRVVVTEAKPSVSVEEKDSYKRSVEYLRSRIAIALADPSLTRGRVGIKVVSMDSGEVIFERSSESYFVPASNMKSFTVAAALDRLGPDYRFVTSIYVSEKPDAGGKITGNLIVYGRGDPAISGSFNGGNPFIALDNIAEKIVAAGVRRIEGNIVGDESYYNSVPVPYGWEWDDLQWYYGAEVSPLSVNDNSVTLKVTPGKAGESCSVSIHPASRLIRIVNTTKTVAKGGKKTLAITKSLGENVFEVSGDVPAGDAGFSGNVAISKPAAIFADLLKQRLEMKGVEITGVAESAGRKERDGKPLETASLVEIASHPSPPLRLIAEKTMKPSQNLYTEMILRSLGEITGDPNAVNKTSDEKGIEAVRDLLKRAGVDPDSVVQYDGSGLSRHNLITPNASMKVYEYMDKGRYSAVWRDSLTIGGVDGTLRRRFRSTSASANVRGKTGTLDQVSALSGYVTSKAGERFVFSILTNNIPDAGKRVSTIDSIVLLLSDFEGTTSAESAGDRAGSTVKK